MAPAIHWNLPKGFQSGEMVWPLPEKIRIPSLTDYGYHDHLLLMVPVEVPEDLKEGSAVTLTAEVNWLVCKESCLPGKAVLNLRVPIQKAGSQAPSQDAKWFKEEQTHLPESLPGDWKAHVNPVERGYVLHFTTGSWEIKKADFFPLDFNMLDNQADVVFSAYRNSFEMRLKESDQLLSPPDRVRGLVVVWDAKGQKHGYWIDVPFN